MAALNDEAAAKKKRKRINGKKKLLIHDKVEVRSTEEGFLGSWHAGTVVGCGELRRRIKYDEILDDDGSERLVEWVKVSPVLDGLVRGNQATSNCCRGNIRPLPPSVDFQKWSLHYGQCVDVFVQDAWWEGVIFDHEDGSDQRKVFFPDMGDEVKAQIETFRITREWDDITDEWRPRGNWLLLELIEEVELEWPLLVSVKQIWYEIRVKMEFGKLKEWTSSSRDIWRQLLLQVLSTSYKLTVKQIFHELNSSENSTEEGQPLFEFSANALDAILDPESIFSDSMAIVPYGTNCQLETHAALSADLNPSEEQNAPNALACIGWVEMDNSTHSMKRPNELPCVQAPAFSGLPPNPDHSPEAESGAKSGRCPTSSDKLNGKLKASGDRTKLQWLPAGIDMVPGTACCPGSVTDYIQKCKLNFKSRAASTLEVRMHISYLGWKIQFARDKAVTRMRYISPEGEIHYSLYQVCLRLQPGSDVPSRICQDDESNSDDPVESSVSSSLTVIPKADTGALKVLSCSEPVYFERDNCPEAVLNYSNWRGTTCHGQNGAKGGIMALKAKRHLSFLGWKFYLEPKGFKKEMRYGSPCGKKFYSLRSACHWCVTEGRIHLSNDAYNSKQIKEPFASQECGVQLTLTDPSPPSNAMVSEGHVNDDLSKQLLIESSSKTSQPKQLAQQGQVKCHGIRGPERKRNHCLLQQSLAALHTGPQNEDSYLLDDVKESQASAKQRDDVNAEMSSCVLRSSKRARQSVVSPSIHQTPRTTLSWLIDNNVVLPRAKVHYRGKKDGRVMKEGKITREGIKCTCCQKVFTLSKFEAHAGSNYHRPSANIFLEDGRSIFQCLLKLKGETNKRKIRSEPHEMKGHSLHNDHICSVCHYGGELVLCDQCPSSFHTICLGLKEVPDGDWFCPSCCCGICGLSRLNEDTGRPVDDRLINCGQCERQYHIECLKKKGLVKRDCHPERNWFCNEKCEQIHLSLHNLLGKPIPVGHDNLTWTLLKYKNAEDSDQDGLDNEHLMESYSKLNIALSVMHECFEPMKEPRTKRDLVEDVIFSRWSELNRLNFQGFYTVVLERDDDLITVATVRVYGEKVAEIPLVATRFQYRRLGMCRIMMNELEKKLIELGVQRLVLPAVPSVLSTWETSFGFSRMTESERLNFLDCTFLDFQGSHMCQKLLKNTQCTELIQLTGVQQKLSPHSGEKDNDLEARGAASEVLQAEQVEDIEVVDQGAADLLREIGSNNSSVVTPSVIVVNQPPEPVNQPPELVNQLAEPVNQSPLFNFLSCQNEINLGYSVGASGQRNHIFKCYKRRRLATCGS
ncbi:uncharacterized protein LOC113780994 [Coffea eugenioides]|uniref:Increased DNA methylation 1-like n=1 Tax=Coffea arabica TaxID=13443 RepID=A0A6P6UII1_COFAR|nr:uncharacterized protein LOC113711298 isoform X2 [Coffea arabica]XP_027182617.1 uncharacterized protein LOC113780994 [Coffea eugenioides]